MSFYLLKFILARNRNAIPINQEKLALKLRDTRLAPVAATATVISHLRHRKMLQPTATAQTTISDLKQSYLYFLAIQCMDVHDIINLRTS